jgi:hypothetical protein
MMPSLQGGIGLEKGIGVSRLTPQTCSFYAGVNAAVEIEKLHTMFKSFIKMILIKNLKGDSDHKQVFDSWHLLVGMAMSVTNDFYFLCFAHIVYLTEE